MMRHDPPEPPGNTHEDAYAWVQEMRLKIALRELEAMTVAELTQHWHEHQGDA